MSTTYISPAQFAKRFSVHPETVRRMVREGKLKSVTVGGQKRIPVSEVARIESTTAATDAEG